MIRRALTSRPVRRLVFALGATAIAAGLLTGASAPPAAAAPNQYGPSIGRLTGFPATGPTSAAPTFWTTAPCPAGSTGVNAFVDSTDAGLAGAVAVASDQVNVPTIMSTGMPSSLSLADIATSANRTLVNGTYDVSLVCLPDFFGSPALGQFDGTFVVSGGATPTSPGTTYTFVTPQPTGVAFDGLEAVTPASGPVLLKVLTTPPGAAGTVQVQEVVNGAPVNLGAPQRTTQVTTVSVALPTGDHALRAVFTPDDPAAFMSATSATATTTVTAPQTRTATTTTLTLRPRSALFGQVVVDGTISVSPATSGTVDVLDGSTVAAKGLPVDRGVTFVGLFAGPGVHRYTAVFTPARADLFDGSASAPVTLDVQPLTPTTVTAQVTPRRGEDCDRRSPCGPALSLRAQVLPRSATGKVVFQEFGSVGLPTVLAEVPVVRGRARATVPIPSGTHRVQALFVPADDSGFALSVSAAVTVVVPDRQHD